MRVQASRSWSIIATLPAALVFAAFAADRQPQFAQAKPVDRAALLPEPNALLESVKTNQNRLEADRRNYICRRKDEETIVKRDNAKTTVLREYEVYYIGPFEIDRLIALDGRSVSGEQVKKQNAEVAKQERKARELMQSLQTRGDADNDTITVSKFLAASEFSNLREELLQGRTVYAFNFQPRPGFRPKGKAEQILQRLGGTIWVDEQSQELARLEAHLLGDFRVLGGLLASVSKGASFVFENQCVNNEVWLPSYGEAHYDSRILLRGKRRDIALSYTDYRKFRVESKISGVDEQPAKK
jgi:hypothetical protein